MNGAGSLPKLLIVGSSGYVGSRLVRHFRETCAATIVGCDLLPSMHDLGCPDIFWQGDYHELPDEMLAGVLAVFWFAGHSSVAMARDDAVNAVHNNVTALAALLERTNALGIPVVYASSASVLSSDSNQFSVVASEQRANAYDASKLALDLLAPYLNPASLGLRMGTVSGWSPKMRWELVFNAMCHDACTNNFVRVQNSGCYRGLLFLDDLCRYLTQLWRRVVEGEAIPSGTVPLVSWTGTIGGLAVEIAHAFGAELRDGGDTNAYSFVAPVGGVRSFVGEGDEPVWPCAIAVQCMRFARACLPEKTV